MSTPRINKINLLLQIWSQGTVATTVWLKGQGIKGKSPP